MKGNDSALYRMNKKKISSFINNKNYSTYRLDELIKKKKKGKYININYYFKEKEDYFSSSSLNKNNSEKYNSTIKKDIIYNLKSNINNLIDNHKNNNERIKPKTPYINKKSRMKFKNDISYGNYHKDEEKTNKNNYLEVNKNNYTKIDNSRKSFSSIGRLNRNRSARNIKYSEVTLFKNNNRKNNSNLISTFQNYKKILFSNNYLKYLMNNKNKEDININKLVNDNNIDINKNDSKDKYTQDKLIENYNNIYERSDLLINPNDIFLKKNYNFYIKKNLLIKENNAIKSENKIFDSKDNNVRKIKIIKPINQNDNHIYNLKKNNLDSKEFSSSKKIKEIKISPEKKYVKEIGNESNKKLNKDEKQKKIKIKIKFHNESFEKNDKERIKAYDVITQAGKDRNNFRKINQDNYIISTNINKIKNFNIFGVLDGHGLYGHLISIFVGRYILNKFINNDEIQSCSNCEELYIKLKNNNFEIINSIFVNAEKELYTAEFDSNFSGTTCIIVIVVGKHIICANTGDSRAILIYSDIEKINNFIKKQSINEENIKNSKENIAINSYYQIKNIIKPFSNNRRSSSISSEEIQRKLILKKNKKIINFLTKIFCLSNDLKPSLPSEKKRILKYGGRVEQLKEKDGNLNTPSRVWVKDQMYPGLAMSRSIGDFIASSVGVIPNPQIIEYTLDMNSRYMVIATDGIWEFMTNEKVMKIGNKFYPKHEPIDLCNELVNEANKNWEKEEIIRDDITVLVVYF